MLHVIFVATDSGVTHPKYWEMWRQNPAECTFWVHQPQCYEQRPGWNHLPTKHMGCYMTEITLEMYLEIFDACLHIDGSVMDTFVFVSGNTIPIRPFSALHGVLDGVRCIFNGTSEAQQKTAAEHCRAYDEKRIEARQVSSVSRALTAMGTWWILSRLGMTAIYNFFMNDKQAYERFDYAWAYGKTMGMESHSPDEFYMQFAAICRNIPISSANVMLSFMDPEINTNSPTTFEAGKRLFEEHARLEDLGPVYHGDINQAIFFGLKNARNRLSYFFFRKAGRGAHPDLAWIKQDFLGVSGRIINLSPSLEPPIVHRPKRTNEDGRHDRAEERVKERMGGQDLLAAKRQRAKLLEAARDEAQNIWLLQKALKREEDFEELTKEEKWQILHQLKNSDAATLTHFIQALNGTKLARDTAKKAGHVAYTSSSDRGRTMSSEHAAIDEQDLARSWARYTDARDFKPSRPVPDIVPIRRPDAGQGARMAAELSDKLARIQDRFPHIFKGAKSRS